MSNIFTDPDSRNNIIIGTVGSSFLGASFGGAYAVLKYIRPFRTPMLTMAGSWGLVGFTFFGGKKGVAFGMLAVGSLGYTTQKIYTYLYRYRQKLIIDELNLGTVPQQKITNTDLMKKIELEDGYSYQPNSYAAKLRMYVEGGYLDKFPKWFPIRTITNDEYIKILDTREQEIMERLVIIDGDLAALQNITSTKNNDNQ
ncbi:hypothetical protein AYI68_g79 [Smittium mucronatum]|uniref:Transmembrane protein n=1 Tax=Smittium mucronatum TaxID=133383 RepID=A0A1R0H986_9FUNG|nr:hypothetical protein AYI68_g79 [Smittium mucronatum]